MFFLDRSQALKTRKENHPHRPWINAAQCRVSDTAWTHRTLHTNGHSTTYALGCWSSPNVYDKQKLREPWDLSKVAQLVLRNHPSRNWKCYSVFPGEGSLLWWRQETYTPIDSISGWKQVHRCSFREFKLEYKHISFSFDKNYLSLLWAHNL